MVNPNRFYTYAYLREDGTPYYIGKGEGRRAYKKRKGEIGKPTDKTRIIFLKQNLTEEEAFRHEIYMIAVFGRKDIETGILRNRTDGGEGPSGIIPWNKGKPHSEGTKRKQSELKKGKNNPNYGKTVSEETRKKQSEALKGKIWSDELRQNMIDTKKGWFSITKEDRSKRTTQTNYQKWMCLETGFITNAGNLSRYQMKRGIDTSKRKRIS